MVRLPSSNAKLITSDGAVLEARWDEPTEARAVVVFCHPHPQYGGTMHAPLMHRVALGLVNAGFSVLRFNFRGVGASTGTWGGGTDEIGDVDAAVTAARRTHPDLALSLAGWSFGALTSLRWQARTGNASGYAGIALPLDMYSPPRALAPGHRTLIIGDRDQFATVSATRAYGAQIGATVEVLAGSDHFFVFRHDRVTELLVQAFDAQPTANS
jgi:alpha/beta superfamily hydrolase